MKPFFVIRVWEDILESMNQKFVGRMGYGEGPTITQLKSKLYRVIYYQELTILN